MSLKRGERGAGLAACQDLVERLISLHDPFAAEIEGQSLPAGLAEVVAGP